MADSHATLEDTQFVRRAVEAAIRIGVLALLAAWSFMIMRPFIMPIMWGVIIAVAVFPAYGYLTAKLGGRRRLTASLITVLALALLLVPSVRFFGGTFDAVRSVAEQMDVIGEDVHGIWSQASANLEATLQGYEPQVRAFGRWLLSSVAGLGMSVVQFVISIIIAGVFLAMAEGGKGAAVRVATRFAGDRGAALTTMTEKTIRSVAIGVVGIALIQSAMGGIGMALAGVPAAGLWALLILILAVIQLPPLLVLGPVAIYVFSSASTVTAVLFLIWAIIVSGSDTFLKPLFLGRGVDVPMLVVLLGAIGGMMLSGIIGLFLGAVILAIAYQLFIAWLEDAPPLPAEAADTAGG